MTEKIDVFFLDTEFNSLNGQLISLALVPMNEGTRPFYRELTLTEVIDPWVAEHVIPLLDGDPVDLPQFQQELEAYLNKFQEVLIIADWPDDIAYLNKAFITGPGTAIKTPPMMLCLDRRIDEVESKKPHHALYDATANRRFFIDHLLTKKQ